VPDISRISSEVPEQHGADELLHNLPLFDGYFAIAVIAFGSSFSTPHANTGAAALPPPVFFQFLPVRKPHKCCHSLSEVRKGFSVGRHPFT
jgi:hypothetical protein